MTKANVTDLSNTAASNEDIIDAVVGVSSPMGDVNDAIRNMGKMLADFYDDLAGNNTVGGTADAITLTTLEVFSSLSEGLFTAFQAGSAITGASTINVDGLGVKAIRRNGDTATESGDIIAGGIYLIRYDTSANSSAGAWILLNKEPPPKVTVLDDDTFATATSTDPSSSEATKTYVDGKFVNHSIKLITANGYGSTATRIPKFSTVQTNTSSTSMTLTQSATLGDSITIDIAGMYSIIAELESSDANREYGITLNQSVLTTNITLLSSAEQLATGTSSPVDRRNHISWVGYLSASAVIRLCTDGGTLSAGTRDCSLEITRIW